MRRLEDMQAYEVVEAIASWVGADRGSWNPRLLAEEIRMLAWMTKEAVVPETGEALSRRLGFKKIRDNGADGCK